MVNIDCNPAAALHQTNGFFSRGCGEREMQDSCSLVVVAGWQSSRCDIPILNLASSGLLHEIRTHRGESKRECHLARTVRSKHLP